MRRRERYPLQDLFDVRTIREDTAARAYATTRKQIEIAEDHLATIRAKLEEYKAWRQTREEALYSEIIDHAIIQKDLKKLHFKLQQLREKQHEFEAQLIQCEKQLSDAQELAETARNAYIVACRNRKKLEEHKDIWNSEQRRTDEMDALKETEDFKPQFRMHELSGAI
ncbi:YscO family type III secretion system apparatus protein [Bremerella sp. JC770]|uniref:type III secretion system stalk subunit SctO n=1 Tax=Bremerella sp. JC770 TaxID=3232137 RepID=UPI00345A831A